MKNVVTLCSKCEIPYCGGDNAPWMAPVSGANLTALPSRKKTPSVLDYVTGFLSYRQGAQGRAPSVEVSGFVSLVFTLPVVRFAFGELRNSVRFANSITAFHFFAATRRNHSYFYFF